MFKYIKGFYRFIVGEGSSTTEPQQTKPNSDVNSNYQKMDDQTMKTRVSYQYPKGNFRFPLISDAEVSKQVEKRPERKKEQPRQQPKQQPRQETKYQPKWATVKPKERPLKDQTKNSFKSTDVPSPVHGFYSTIEKQQQVIEYELPASTVNNRKPSSEREYEPELNEAETTVTNEMLQLEEEKLWFEDAESSIAVTEEVLEETVQGEGELPEQNFTYDEIKSLEVDEESVAYEEEVALDTTEEKEVVGIEENQTEAVQAEPTPKKYVPFNVVMLKQDRERLKEKQEKEKQTSPSSSPAYRFPPLHFLSMPKHDHNVDDHWLQEQQELLDVTLHNFNVRAKVVNVTQGPSVTRYEVHPEPGVKVNKITNLSDDIKLALSAKDIRMEAPIPGKNTIGIEVPNKKSKPVLLSEIISTQEFRGNPSPLTVALGLDISGKPIVTDLKKMPHGLIAGATGSGKSVCINAMLISLLYKADPSQVKLLLIDPKMVELAPYNDIPHLVSPVITDVKAATAALKWAVEEMERRYERFVHSGVRDISRYNELVREHNEPSGEMPYLVIVIDELADLMMVAPGEVEESICRIAQKARACGIHLLLATQRPSVDVITGLIKANIPTRIAFSVSSQVDSRTIIDTNGADKLLGKGDMLFLENGSSKPYRLQGNFVSDQEIEQAVSFVKSQQKPEYLFEQQELISKSSSFTQEEDELFYEACEFVIDQGGASSSSLQRRFRIGYNRAARLIEMMEEQGFISEQKGSKPRDVLITEDQFLEKQMNQ